VGINSLISNYNENKIGKKLQMTFYWCNYLQQTQVASNEYLVLPTDVDTQEVENGSALLFISMK